MNKADGFCAVLALALVFPAPSFAQSTLEYAGLISETSAAAVGAAGHKKSQSQNATTDDGSGSRGLVGGAVTSLYGGASDVLAQKGAGFLGQMGQPPGGSVAAAPAEHPSPAPETKSDVSAAQVTEGPRTVRVKLRNGLTISGSLVEQNKDYIKVDSAGVVVTYFADEIDKVE